MKLKVMKPQASKSASLVVVGTVAIDAIETPFGKRNEVFGGSASYFSYAASFFTPVAVVAVVGSDFPDRYRRILEERDIDLSHLQVLPGKTFFWRGKYEHDMNAAITLETQLNVLSDFNPKLTFQAHPNHLFLANIDPVLQIKVLDQLDRRRLNYIACDTMNYWITHKPKVLRHVLARVDCIVLNDGEARQLTGEVNLIRAGQKVRDMGPQHVVIKKGEHGVLLFYGSQYCALPAYPLETVYDPTGAGDTFAGAMMGYLSRNGDLSFESFKQALAMGTIVASFTVEDFGLDSLRNSSRKDLEERLGLFKKMCGF